MEQEAMFKLDTASVTTDVCSLSAKFSVEDADVIRTELQNYISPGKNYAQMHVVYTVDTTGIYTLVSIGHKVKNNDVLRKTYSR